MKYAKSFGVLLVAALLIACTGCRSSADDSIASPAEGNEAPVEKSVSQTETSPPPAAPATTRRTRPSQPPAAELPDKPGVGAQPGTAAQYPPNKLGWTQEKSVEDYLDNARKEIHDHNYKRELRKLERTIKNLEKRYQ